jgi:hypothetical protein
MTVIHAPCSLAVCPREVVLDASQFQVGGKRTMRVLEYPQIIAGLSGIDLVPLTQGVCGMQYMAYTFWSEDDVMRVVVPNLDRFFENRQDAYAVLAHESGHHVHGFPHRMSSRKQRSLEKACDKHAHDLGHGGLLLGILGRLTKSTGLDAMYRIQHLDFLLEMEETKAPI